jgi:integrase family protein with SAM-like domain
VTDLAPVAGAIVTPARLLSARDVRAHEWDQDTAWNAAVDIWLRSVMSQHSRDAYLCDITLWREWCDANDVPLDDARRSDVQDWRDGLTGAPSTIARRISAVFSFYGYWLGEGIVTRNPARKVARPKVSRQPSSIALSLSASNLLPGHVDGLTDPGPWSSPGCSPRPGCASASCAAPAPPAWCRSTSTMC